MIYQSSKTIEAALKAQNLRCDVMEGPDSSAVVTGFDLKSGDAATIHFISMSDANDVAVRVFHFAQGDPAKLWSVVNDLNCKFRYAKFTLRDGEVCVELDIPQETTDVGKVAFELLVRSLDIMAEASPELKAAGAEIKPAQAPAEPAPAEPAAPSVPADKSPEPKKGFLGGLFGGGNGK